MLQKWYSCPFGAFMMGSIMPDISKLNDIYRKVEDVAVILLLPLFFCIYRFENRNWTYQ
jgi:Kef-type K+ transport system membrane component KefB